MCLYGMIGLMRCLPRSWLQQGDLDAVELEVRMLHSSSPLTMGAETVGPLGMVEQQVVGSTGI
jgi:hypothetical protein